MCQFRIHYQTVYNQRIDKFTFPYNQQTSGWEMLEETNFEDNKGIRFNFGEISGYGSDMVFSNNTIFYHSPK